MSLREHSAELAVVLNLSIPIHQTTGRFASARLYPDEYDATTAEPQLSSCDVQGERALPQIYVSDISSSVADSLAAFFVSFLPPDARVERVFWTFEGHVVRVWTIIDAPDDEIERPIYDAQSRFIHKFPDLDCDFCVIYRFGKRIEDMEPSGAMVVPLQQ